MDRKLGKTGLTQKDAVFEVVKGVLGKNYDPKVSVESMIAHKSDGYVKPQWHSSVLDQMIALVAQGLRDGTVPSKYNSSNSELQIRQYANRITHYWITHDKRLNGNTSGTRTSKLKARNIAIKHRLANDAILNKFRSRQMRAETLEEGLQIHLWIMGGGFRVVLEAYGIDPSELPEEIQKALYLNSEGSLFLEKKEAA